MRSKLISGVSGTDAAQKRQGVRIWTVGTALGKAGVLRSAPVDRGRRGRGVPARLLPFPGGLREGVLPSLCSERRVVRASGKVEWEQDSVVA